MIVVQAREPDRGKLLFNGSVGSFNASWDRRVISTRSTVGDGKPSRSDPFDRERIASEHQERALDLPFHGCALLCSDAYYMVPYTSYPLPLLGGGPGPKERQRSLLRTTGAVRSSLDHDWVVIGMPNSFNEHARIRCVSSAHLPTFA